jgi:hypothetical protein
MAQWFYQVMGEAVGPVSSAKLQNLAQHGTISADTLVRSGTNGDWILAERISVLFPVSTERFKNCPFCGEQILAVAIKCKHCGSDLAEKKATVPGRPNKTAAPRPASGAVARNSRAKWLRSITLTIIAWLAVAVPIFVIVAIPEIDDWRAGRISGSGTELAVGLLVRCLALAAVLAATIYLYFLPTIMAKRSNHPHHYRSSILNVGLGWTFIGWLGALAWALMIREGGNCWRYNARLNGFPSVCQFCQAQLTWDQGCSRSP